MEMNSPVDQFHEVVQGSEAVHSSDINDLQASNYKDDVKTFDKETFAGTRNVSESINSENYSENSPASRVISINETPGFVDRDSDNVTEPPTRTNEVVSAVRTSATTSGNISPTANDCEIEQKRKTTNAYPKDGTSPLNLKRQKLGFGALTKTAHDATETKKSLETDGINASSKDSSDRSTEVTQDSLITTTQNQTPISKDQIIRSTAVKTGEMNQQMSPKNKIPKTKNTFYEDVIHDSLGRENNTQPNDKLADKQAICHVLPQHRRFPELKKLTEVRPLQMLNTVERMRLERLFGFDRHGGKTWDEDWAGVLSLVNSADVINPDGDNSGEKSKKRSILEWVGLNTKITRNDNNSFTPNNSLKMMNYLLRFVYNYKNTPDQAKLILANIDMNSPSSIGDAMVRICIDPTVLKQDGWTIEVAAKPEGKNGGSHRIGEKIWWDGYLGVVIAYMYDDDYGDLWKGMWVEDSATFDLEVEELNDAIKRFKRKSAASSLERKRRKLREASMEEFKVDGIEHGIVLATSFARGSKIGVFWPARVLHASELSDIESKRNRSKKKVDVVFLAPYWNSDHSMIKNAGRRAEILSDSVGEKLFSSGRLFEIECIDAKSECIQRYPYDADTGLDIDSLRSSFKLMGLPKDAFPRFLDSQRMALGFRTFSQNELKSSLASDHDRTSAGLLEGHPLTVQTAHFPTSVLQLPFEHMLSQLPHHEKHMLRQESYPGEESSIEPALQFAAILSAMNPPACWGGNVHKTNQDYECKPKPMKELASPVSFSRLDKGTAKDDPYDVNRFINGLPSLHSLLSERSHTGEFLKYGLNDLMAAYSKSFAFKGIDTQDTRNEFVKSANQNWILLKSQGESMIAAQKNDKCLPFLKDWTRCCERIFKHINAKSANDSVSFVITDSRCNLHLTSSECYERAVRLPAALKGVRKARGNIRIMDSVPKQYIDLAETKIIARAHKMAYIQRIKKRCIEATGNDVVALTDDSDGNGGEDTKGSKGTWNAAILGVGAALQGVDLIMSGECLNVFCATRPPGHHAGRDLHAMKAVSNGFCILNPVACAAIYATCSVREGGLGLSRVCVIDFDVHHGNGTQDVLCSTYDPRFLYISMHAGGPDINGIDFDDNDLEQIEHHLGRNPKKGIFPGRCGDISPHKGVLNIPLGNRVTPDALGTALVTKVNPRVEAFNPDLIIISAGFDAHKHDPLNMGGLAADDFGTLTEVICKMSRKLCSGRVLSVMEGGYGVPCCRPQKNYTMTSDGQKALQPFTLQCLDLGTDLPPEMSDVISSYSLQKRLDKCHQEGFVHCVTEHVSALAKFNSIPQ